MVPPHVLQKMRAALLALGAASAACTRARVAAEVADGSDTTDGGTATQIDASYTDAAGDAADSRLDDAGALDAAADDASFGTIGCPIHGSHLLLPDGGLQQSAGVKVVSGGLPHGFQCRACGMGGVRDDPPPGATPKVPQGQAQLGGVSGAPADSDLPRLLAGMRARVRACYQRGLESDPTMAGKLVVHAVFGPNGECTKVEASSNTGLSPAVQACVTSAVRRLQTNGPADITLPINFVPQ